MGVHLGRVSKIADNGQIAELTATLRHIPQIVSRIPPSALQTRELLNEAIADELGKMLQVMMTADERERQGRGDLDAETRRTIHRKLDALILSQASTFAVPLLSCDIVIARFKVWSREPEGPAKIKEFCKGWTKYARVHLGHEKPPFDDPTIYYFKQETVPELRLILKRLRDWHAVKRLSVTGTTLAEEFFKEARNDASLIHLAMNHELWASFFNDHPDYLKCAVAGKKRQSPAAMFDDWYGWVSRREPKKVRDLISKLGNLVPIAARF